MRRVVRNPVCALTPLRGAALLVYAQSRMSPEAQELAVGTQEQTVCLPLEWRVFCAEVAEGKTYRDAGVSAGFSANYGDMLINSFGVREKVNELVQLIQRSSEGIVDKVWAELILLKVVKSGLEGEAALIEEDGTVLRPGVPPDRELVLAALNQLGKIKGWVVERKQIMNARLDYGKVSQDTLTGLLADQLGILSPEQQEQVRTLANGSMAPATSNPQASKSSRRSRRSSQSVDVVASPSSGVPVQPQSDPIKS